MPFFNQRFRVFILNNFSVESAEWHVLPRQRLSNMEIIAFNESENFSLVNLIVLIWKSGLFMKLIRKRNSFKVISGSFAAAANRVANVLWSIFTVLIIWAGVLIHQKRRMSKGFRTEAVSRKKLPQSLDFCPSMVLNNLFSLHSSTSIKLCIWTFSGDELKKNLLKPASSWADKRDSVL